MGKLKVKYKDILEALRAEAKSESGELLLHFKDGHRQIRRYESKKQLKQILIEMYLECIDYLNGHRFAYDTVERVYDTGNDIWCHFEVINQDMNSDEFTAEFMKEIEKWKEER